MQRVLCGDQQLVSLAGLGVTYCGGRGYRWVLKNVISDSQVEIKDSGQLCRTVMAWPGFKGTGRQSPKQECLPWGFYPFHGNL